ncbi:MAG: hypothetical protein QM783_18215 [Phycisphaerales bacterium]
MSFGSHNLVEENEGEARGGACPLSRYLGWLPFWRSRRTTERRRKWVRAAAWGAKGVAALYVLACVKCILLYIVIPAVVAWGGWGVVSGGGGSGHERAAEPSSVPGIVLPEVSSGGTDVSDAEERNAEAAR